MNSHEQIKSLADNGRLYLALVEYTADTIADPAFFEALREPHKVVYFGYCELALQEVGNKTHERYFRISTRYRSEWTETCTDTDITYTRKDGQAIVRFAIRKAK